MNLLNPLLQLSDKGLYCKAGDFYVDPWRAVPRALITHAHGDHARWGSQEYWGAQVGKSVLQLRLGAGAKVSTLTYGEVKRFRDAEVSLHPAGHIFGSAQIRIEAEGQVWVVSGDYKRDFDPTCEPFQVVPCDVFITEATFALPIYHWQPGEIVAREILEWWDRNRALKRTSLLFCYALGKAQRVLAELAALTERSVWVHGAVEPLTELYREAGIRMLPTLKITEAPKGQDFRGELVLAPPSAFGSLWMRRFKDAETGFASGWMQVRGARRRKSYERGFVLSDHADWPSLLRTVRETGARHVIATHGSSDILARYLNEQGTSAATFTTAYGGEEEETLESKVGE